MKKTFVCNNCGMVFSKWMGQCTECGEWGGVEEEIAISPGSIDIGKTSLKPQKLSSVEPTSMERMSTGFGEFDRVLGGEDHNHGFVKGQVVLLCGQPGIGKSTLLLQLMFNNVSRSIDTLYVSGEESISQINVRANRLIEHSPNYDIDILDNSEVANISDVDQLIAVLGSMESKPKFLILDSIQTLYTTKIKSLAGSVAQIKFCTNKIVEFAKQHNVVTIIVGHINKEGDIAGPKMLEHMVDSVFQLEGDEKTGVRMLRSLKNRYGPTMEIGMFDMRSEGMLDLADPSVLFGVDAKGEYVGVCRAVVVEGQRPFVIEIQSLITRSPFSLPKRVAEGIPVSRLQRISAILSKYQKVDFSDKDIYLKISGGIKVQDPAIDLAVAISLISSSKNKSPKSRIAAFGELNLTGVVAYSSRYDDRVREATRLGYKVIAADQKGVWLKDILSEIL